MRCPTSLCSEIEPHGASDKDKLKQETLQEMGITVLRFCDEDVMKSIEEVLGVIRNFIRDFEEKH